MNNQGEIVMGDKSSPIKYEFTMVGDQAYLSLSTNGAVAQFHLTMLSDDNQTPSPLDNALKSEKTAQAVISEIVESCTGSRILSEGYNRPNLVARNCAQFALTSNFRDFSTRVQSDQPIASLDMRKSHAVQVRRTTIPRAEAA